ncbi:hypothetical protein EV702DRAFT_1136134 [Suillus placidus]|uniref:Transmembrane protein n=1 Tax=Suillus placidus TaxID=48579 RepID=A0A9P6ZLT4_9AGAM|nr:hypothetical protein EV702DRAFT_1136134 [Suillus placidus]
MKDESKESNDPKHRRSSTQDSIKASRITIFRMARMALNLHWIAQSMAGDALFTIGSSPLSTLLSSRPPRGRVFIVTTRRVGVLFVILCLLLGFVLFNCTYK